MTFDDMQVVERYVADLRAGEEPKLPVMLSTEYDRVDVDAGGLSCDDAEVLACRLSQSLGRKGYLWDVWITAVDRMIHVAEREEAS